MPRPRKPTAVLEANGAFIHDPQRRDARANEPKPDPNFGNAPRNLTASQKKLWVELTDLVAPDVLTKADRWIVRLTILMAEKVFDGTATSSQTSCFQRCLSQLGMTPADRSKIKVPDAPQVDEWEEDFGAVN